MGVLGRFVPGLEPAEVAGYLVEWGDDVLESTERKKAYDDDHYDYGDDWQLVDFTKRLGLDYPMDESRGKTLRKTLRFSCRSDLTVKGDAERRKTLPPCRAWELEGADFCLTRG